MKRGQEKNFLLCETGRDRSPMSRMVQDTPA
jgi:hypothetical protein